MGAACVEGGEGVGGDGGDGGGERTHWRGRYREDAVLRVGTHLADARAERLHSLRERGRKGVRGGGRE